MVASVLDATALTVFLQQITRELENLNMRTYAYVEILDEMLPWIDAAFCAFDRLMGGIECMQYSDFDGPPIRAAAQHLVFALGDVLGDRNEDVHLPSGWILRKVPGRIRWYWILLDPRGNRLERNPGPLVG